MGGWAIAVHGGAGVDPNLPLERQEEAKQLLTRVLNLGISALRSNLSAIDVVELVVHVLFCSVLPRTHIHTPIMFCPVPLFLPL
jgi:isoaspartyl peptidase/L-asparaginase-like protein (Ntn-hydrolase superfamily)